LRYIEFIKDKYHQKIIFEFKFFYILYWRVSYKIKNIIVFLVAHQYAIYFNAYPIFIYIDWFNLATFSFTCFSFSNIIP
jgi:hypothetical protein